MNKTDHNKFANAVLYLLKGCKQPPGLTKLLKMLYNADFRHYRKHLRSITHAPYVALPRGPAPDKYEDALDALERGGIIARMSVAIVGLDKLMTEFQAKKAPNMCVFDDTEIEVLDEILNECAHKTGVALSEASHLEGPWSWAWNAESPGQPVPYVLGRWLENRCDDDDMSVARRALERAEVAEQLSRLS
jgi:uncharacterized phage-associated protein